MFFSLLSVSLGMSGQIAVKGTVVNPFIVNARTPQHRCGDKEYYQVESTSEAIKEVTIKTME